MQFTSARYHVLTFLTERLLSIPVFFVTKLEYSPLKNDSFRGTFPYYCHRNGRLHNNLCLPLSDVQAKDMHLY